MPIDLYGSTISPPCRSVIMLTKHLKLDVNLKSLDMRGGEHLKPEFLKINPAHTIPTLVDNGYSLWESRAILQYLAAKYGAKTTLYPTDLQKRGVVDRFLNFDFSLATSVGQAILYPIFRGTEPTEAQLKTHKDNLKLLDTLLGNNKYAAGDDLTIADLAIIGTLASLVVNDFKDLTDVPNVKKYVDTLSKELPYYKDISDGIVNKIKEMKAAKK